ncbi:Protein MAK16 [Tilletia horrida]|uniref:Protein MAK16 n=1 Tax=Tilletia horrida TaxID=155126 RepID=A0AAN6G8R2_9BASI|nr:Protein MAK16 [Tilletia horrida]KAK0538047.1 Protein MAK16 [Tilletia horrida]KAK0563184.1 Protein MAK16 [Tilletia horrida]
MAASDDAIWAIIRPGGNFCSFRLASTTHSNFCRNEYNLTGLCTRQSCPLANARYATVREREGVVYLYIKTAERAHSPARMWERVQLSRNYSRALEQIDKELIYWPSFIVHKSKQRLTKITQYLIKLRKIALKAEEQPELIGVRKKEERRERTRENKAMRAAKLEKSIEKELLDRLKSGAYGDAPLNVNESVWNEVLERRRIKEKEGMDELEAEADLEEDDEEMLEGEEEQEWDGLEDEEDEEDGVGRREFVSDDDDSEDDDDDIEDLENYETGSDEDMDEGLDDDEGTDDDEDDEDDDEDEEDDSPAARRRGKRPQPPARPAAKPKPGRKAGKPKGGKKLEIEYERETEPLTRDQLANW